jgi:hypothetical protein
LAWPSIASLFLRSSELAVAYPFHAVAVASGKKIAIREIGAKLLIDGYSGKRMQFTKSEQSF